MQKSIIPLLMTLALTASVTSCSQSQSDQAKLQERVAKLEQQVQELSQLTAPLKEQVSADNRRQKLRQAFEQRMARDRQKFSEQQLNEAEQLYQVSNKKWGSPEAIQSLKDMVEKYPDLDRTGCAVLYLAQKAQGDERMKHLQDCMEKYGDCMYGDGVQVGAFARFLLVQDYRKAGQQEKAEALGKELKEKFPDAVGHDGKLLADQL